MSDGDPTLADIVARDLAMKAKQAKPLRLLRMPEVEHRTGLKRARIYQLEAKGYFPKRVKVSERASAWAEHEVEAFIVERMAARFPRPSAVP